MTLKNDVLQSLVSAEHPSSNKISVVLTTGSDEQSPTSFLALSLLGYRWAKMPVSDILCSCTTFLHS